MAVAPRIFNDRATLDVPQARAKPVATEDAMGGAVGRALSGVGDASFKLVAEINRRADEADTREADAEYQRREREILWGRDPDPNVPGDNGVEGFMKKRGVDAIAAREQVEKDLQTAVDDIAGKRRSRAAEDAFRDVAARRLDTTLDSVARRTVSETLTYEDAAKEAQAIESYNSAVASYSDEALAAAHINTGIGVVVSQADALGASPELTEKMIKDFSSRSWAGVILRRVDEDPSGAEAIFKARRGLMNAEDVGKVQSAIKGIVLAQKARKTVDDLMVQSNGDARSFMDLADDISDTTLRDEVVTRGLTMLRQKEEVEARDTDNAEERARTAITKSGFGAVAAVDRALLQREGRWNALVNEFKSAAEGSDGPLKRQSKLLSDSLVAMSVDNPHGYGLIVDRMRGYSLPPNMTEDQFKAQTGMSVADAKALRTRLLPDDWIAARDPRLVQTGQAPISPGGQTLIEKTYEDLRTFAEPLAESQGVNVTAASGTNAPSSVLLQQRGQFRAFLLSEARAFVLANNRQPNQAEIEGIARRALTKGNNGDWFGGDKLVYQTTKEKPVIVPWNRIPPSDQKALMQQWRAENPNAPAPKPADLEKWAERAYAASLEPR